MTSAAQSSSRLVSTSKRLLNLKKDEKFRLLFTLRKVTAMGDRRTVVVVVVVVAMAKFVDNIMLKK